MKPPSEIATKVGCGERFRVHAVYHLHPSAVASTFVVLAYYGVANQPIFLSAVVLVVAWLFSGPPSRIRPLDFAMLLVLSYEAFSLLMSQYPADGVSQAKVICAAAVFYSMVRLVLKTASQVLTASALVGLGGAVLAGFALSQFSERIQALEATGFSGIVAFRSRLIIPPAPWVLGEWFTLLLLTLPFAATVMAFLWAGKWRKLAAVAVLPALAITAALGLSCSRAVFWGVAVFYMVLFGLAAAYRVVSVRTAVSGAVCTLCALAVLVVVENALYPGVMEAYTGRHTSQVRSTEGRLAIWKRSADVFKLSPLWGVGAGNAPLFLAASAEEDQTTGFASRTFSLPVQLLTEKGMVGTALYLAVLVLAAWEAHRKLRNPKVSPQMKGLTCCLAAGVLAVLFRELTYSSLLEHAATAMLFAIILALLAAEEPA